MKAITKKLGLHRETLTSLTQMQLGGARGGLMVKRAETQTDVYQICCWSAGDKGCTSGIVCP